MAPKAALTDTPTMAPTAAQRSGSTSTFWMIAKASPTPMTTLVTASMVWEVAVGTMLERPWKYPRRADSMEMKNRVGARAIMA